MKSTKQLLDRVIEIDARLDEIANQGVDNVEELVTLMHENEDIEAELLRRNKQFTDH